MVAEASAGEGGCLAPRWCPIPPSAGYNLQTVVGSLRNTQRGREGVGASRSHLTGWRHNRKCPWSGQLCPCPSNHSAFSEMTVVISALSAPPLAPSLHLSPSRVIPGEPHPGFRLSLHPHLTSSPCGRNSEGSVGPAGRGPSCQLGATGFWLPEPAVLPVCATRLAGALAPVSPTPVVCSLPGWI